MIGFDISTASNIKLGSSSISALYFGSIKIWPTGIDYSKEYLTIESLEDNNTIGWKANNSDLLRTISWSTDKTNWTDVTSSTAGTTITTLNTGDKIYIKGNNPYYATPTYYNFFTSTGTFNVYGNIMSLIGGDYFSDLVTLYYDYIFSYLFTECNIVNASNLILPATTLTDWCYYCMFYGCSSLTSVPELPATTLSEHCYQDMFHDCTSLTNVPSDLLPATIAPLRCYNGMFNGCTSLITTPELPAIILSERSYSGMFQSCSSLKIAPNIFATTLGVNCCTSMFRDCTSLTTAPTLPATTLVNYCYRQMFQNCISLTTAPELPATILKSSCYYQMFYGCTSLNYIKMMATDISASYCLYRWVSGVSSSGTFVKNSAATWTTTGVSGIPSGWTVQTASA